MTFCLQGKRSTTELKEQLIVYVAIYVYTQRRRGWSYTPPLQYTLSI